MGKIVAGVGISHVPAIGVAMDSGKIDEPYWSPFFAGYGFSQKWLEELRPDAVIIVYNDHANAFSLDLVPTFAVSCGEAFEPCDEGWGRREVPAVPGHPRLAMHLFESLVSAQFDMTLVGGLEVDHGLTVPMSLMFGQVDVWPCPVVPVCVNVVQYPPPSPRRCLDLGAAIKTAVESFPDDSRVVVFGTGGMSHQLQGQRAGLINSEWDRHFLDCLADNVEELADLTLVEMLREAGSEGVELVMWLVMRGALGTSVTEKHRHYHVPVSCTASGHIILENADA